MIEGNIGEEVGLAGRWVDVRLQVGPGGTTSLDQLAIFAQEIETRFQAAPLLTNGLGSS